MDMSTQAIWKEREKNLNTNQESLREKNPFRRMDHETLISHYDLFHLVGCLSQRLAEVD